jgi:peroxiredoxin family protein
MVLSGDWAKIHAAAVTCMVVASLEQPVHVLVSMEALPAFHRNLDIQRQIAKGPVGELIAESGSHYLDLFRQAKELGVVHLYACSLVMSVTRWQLTDLVPVFDDVLGLTTFLTLVGSGRILTF